MCAVLRQPSHVHTYNHTGIVTLNVPHPTPIHTGDSNTRITGDLSHGAFVGTIITPEEQYHIEPASYHFPADHPHHSIIYRSTDVDYTALKGSTCGLSHDGTVENVMEAQGAKRQKRNVPLSTVCVHEHVVCTILCT